MTRTARRLGRAASVGAALVASAACGGSSSTFDGFGSSPNLAGAQGGGRLSVTDAGVTWFDGGGDAFAACATSHLATTLSRVNLVFVYDKSGSMGDPAEGGDPKLKWIPLENGMNAFFSDPASQWISASLTLFPAPGGLQTTCSFDYANPDVPLAPLSASNALVARLAATQPQGGTPTLPALQGGLAYAGQVIAAHPDDVTAVVLVTDGEPGFYVNGQPVAGCANNDLAHVAAAAQAGAAGSPPIRTYVIGVGTDIDGQHANTIAAAGGTQHAFMIAANDATTTAKTFADALASIRTASASCSVPFPTAPDGLAINPSQVNVVLDSGGTQTVVPQDPACSGGTGWFYDAPIAPKAIELCPSTCNAVRSGGGTVDLAFGCATTTLIK